MRLAQAYVSSHSPFDDFPGFYADDNRQWREANPITKGALEAKMQALLPESLVRGRSILDLGSCLGAAGQWALFYGAQSYVGVEVQAAYATRSQELLARWDGKARIVQADIRSFLLNATDQAFDIVIAAGVIYHFVDPETIVRELCRVAKQTVVVESNHPTCVRNGTVGTRALITEYTFDQDVNLSETNESLCGVSACPTIAALDLFFRLNNFQKKEDILPYPLSIDTLAYADRRYGIDNVPMRYAVEYSRRQETKHLRTLEENLPRRDGIRKPWATDPVHTENATKNREVASLLKTGIDKWRFDESVATSFAKIAETSIPSYHRVIDKTIEIIKKRAYQNPKIIDVGSAIGTTLERLYRNGFKNLYGVDSSQAMLDRSFDKAVLINSRTFPMEYGEFDVVIANWVLHFINNRADYLQAIRASLRDNGLLILSEKIESSAFVHSLYHDFKRSNGLTEEEILEKQKRLAGVLTTYPLAWYFETLYNLGFKSVDVVDAHYAFVTLVAQN